jgi:hypothetical protein
MIKGSKLHPTFVVVNVSPKMNTTEEGIEGCFLIRSTLGGFKGMLELWDGD